MIYHSKVAQAKHRKPIARLGISFFIASIAALVVYLQYKATPLHHPDFGLSWFGARALLEGRNPYELVGKGLQYDWPWPLVYPATAFVAAIPLSFLPLLEATVVFVFLSYLILAYSIREDFRYLMFLSFPLISGAAAGQWTPLITAAYALPIAGFFLAAKPTEGLAILIAKLQWKPVVFGAGFFLLLSLVLFPAWPQIWLGQLHYGYVQMTSPVMRMGGFLLLISAIRLKNAEGRLLFVYSLIPQVGTWYTAIPLFLIPKTRIQMMILCGLTSLGWLVQHRFITATNETDLNRQVGALIVLMAYLPALVMVLLAKRENSTGTTGVA